MPYLVPFMHDMLICTHTHYVRFFRVKAVSRALKEGKDPPKPVTKTLWKGFRDKDFMMNVMMYCTSPLCLKRYRAEVITAQIFRFLLQCGFAPPEGMIVEEFSEEEGEYIPCFFSNDCKCSFFQL